jgi:trk system potassium uptake protein
MNIVIAGEDEVAYRLVETLTPDHSVFLVCPESAAGPRLDRLDLEPVHGDMTSISSLQEAGIQTADVFVACSPHDEKNLVACVVAKTQGARRTVCFLFRPDFRAAMAESSLFASRLGIDHMVRPGEQLAREIIRIVTVPGALDVEVFEGGKVQLFRHAIEKGSRITRGPLKDLGVPAGVVLVMVRRGDATFVPKGDTTLQPGDKVTAMGNPRDMNRLLHRLLRAEGKGKESRRVTVVGGGDVGLAVALGLEDLGWEVKIIEPRPERCEEISRVLNSLVLQGDGADLELLEAERVAEDSVLVAVTSNDEKNLLVSLLAKQLGVRRIVTRADVLANERLFERAGVDVVRSAQGAAIQSVLRDVVATRAETLAELEHGDAVVLELELAPDVAPTSLLELKAPGFTIVGAILREGQVIIPRGQDVLQGKDRILVFCSVENEAEARRFFTHGLPRNAAQPKAET